MGKEITKEFNQQYPQIYQEYRQWCKTGRFNLGDVSLWRDADKPWLFNLVTQENYWGSDANLLALEKALYCMRFLADSNGIHILAMPG